MPVSKKRKNTNRGPTPPKNPTPSASRPESPSWYAPVMFALMGLGVLTVISTYIFTLDRIMLLPGLGALAVGMFMTLGYK
jgi:hypothetical protein